MPKRVGSGIYSKIDIMTHGEPVSKEVQANGVITPGQLIERTSTAGDVQRHSTAGGNAAKMFALSDVFLGKEIGVKYANDAKMRCQIFRPGDEVYAIIKDGTAAIVIGSFLESAGDGDLQLHEADDSAALESPEAIVAQALVAIDLSSSSNADPSIRRIPVEII